MIDKAKNLWRCVYQFAVHDVWDVELRSVSFIRRLPLGIVRIITLAVRGFKHDELPLRASALTFTTLLSLAPLFAFVFTIFKGMGRGQDAMIQLQTSMAEMPPQFQEFVARMIEYVEKTSTVGIGSTAVIILLFTVIKVMGSIEASFNKIWGVTSPRALVRKFTDYISTLVLVPMLIVAAGAVKGLQERTDWLVNIPGQALLIMLLSVSIGFSVLYIIMPNTRVRVVPAFIGGFSGAMIWLLWQKLYIAFQVSMVQQQDKVFGAFASVVIFMVWLYVCWVIVLLGAEIAFAIQNYSTYQKERRAGDASSESKVLLGLSMMLRAAKAMGSANESGLDAEQFAWERGVPIRLVNDVLRTLQDADMLVEVADERGGYVLLKSPESLQVKEVIDAVMKHGARPATLGLAQLDEQVKELLMTANTGATQALKNMTLKQAVEQMAS